MAHLRYIKIDDGGSSKSPLKYKKFMDSSFDSQPEKYERQFLSSSVLPEMELCLKQKIDSLPGKNMLLTRSTFSSMCTHVIAQEFEPTEKVLGALAGGKWLLNVNFIHDSYEKGYWLNEEDYEYTNYDKVASYHRLRREERKCGLYDGWKILVVMESHSFTRTFRRLLAAGGAEVASKDDDSGVDFVLTTKSMVKRAQVLVDCLMPLVDVTYVKDTLIFRNDPADLKLHNLGDQPTETTNTATILPTPTTSKCTSKQQKTCVQSETPKRKALSAKKKSPLTTTKTPHRIVHSRALSVAYRVLSLHPPVTSKMRKYYLCVFKSVMQPETVRNYVVWNFLQAVMECASSCDGRSQGSHNTEQEDDFNKATKALHLLEFITTLLTEDIKNAPYGEAVQEVLTWNIFWESSKTSSVSPPPLKRILQMWMSQEINHSVRWHLARLVSVLLEVCWKLSGEPLVPVTALPATLTAIKREIEVFMKGLSSKECVEVVRSLHNPWSQCVVSFIILQDITHCPKKLTLPGIVNLFHCTSTQMSGGDVPQYIRKNWDSLSQNSENSPTLKAFRLHSPSVKMSHEGEEIREANTSSGKKTLDSFTSEGNLDSLRGYKRKFDGDFSRSVSPTQQDHHWYHRQLTLTLANCYLEVSGNRYIFHAIKNFIADARKERFDGKSTTSTKVHDSSGNGGDGKTNHENIVRETSKPHIQQYIHMFENSFESLNEIEETSVAKIYNCIKSDKEVTKSQSLRNAPLMKNMDVKLLFKNLC